MWTVPLVSPVRLAVAVFAATGVQVPATGKVCLYHHAAVWFAMVKVAVVAVTGSANSVTDELDCAVMPTPVRAVLADVFEGCCVCDVCCSGWVSAGICASSWPADAGPAAVRLTLAAMSAVTTITHSGRRDRFAALRAVPGLRGCDVVGVGASPISSWAVTDHEARLLRWDVRAASILQPAFSAGRGGQGWILKASSHHARQS